MSPPRRLVSEVAAAFGLLTRLPVGGLPMPADAAGFARGVWAYPLAGAAVGAAGGAAWLAAGALGLPPALAACWTLAALLLLTGALHEDGLADTADGLGGGGTRARKLAIMRDSRIGSYGALALLLGLAVRGAALVDLGGLPAASALLASGALGRGTILGLLRLLPPARPDGLAAGLGRPGAGIVAAGLGIAAASALLALPVAPALAAIGAAAACCAVLAAVARRQLGGHTGDVLGAGSVLTECAVLTLLASWPR